MSAHGRDEAGWEKEAGHKDMWFAARDIAFEQQTADVDIEAMLQRMGFGQGGGGGAGAAPARLLPDDIDPNLEALRSALRSVACPEALCLVDGFRLPDFGVEQRAVVGGDSKSAAIAAASVLAKVTRDRYMRRAAERHPEWEFATNVGYSTPEHRAAIAAHGISPLHRLSFASIAYQQLALD